MSETTVAVHGLDPLLNYSITAWSGESATMNGAQMRAGLAVSLPPPPPGCSDVNASKKGWTPSACGSSTVIEYRAVA